MCAQNAMGARVGEDDLIDMATNVCDADMDEGDWIPMLVGLNVFFIAYTSQMKQR